MATLSRLLLTTSQKLFRTNGLSGKLLTKNYNHVFKNLGNKNNCVLFPKWNSLLKSGNILLRNTKF